MIGVLALIVGASMQNQVGGLAANILETVRGLTTLATRLLSSLTGTSIQIGGIRLQLPSTQINDVMPQFYESLVGQMS
ncbi:MAG: hypothetical protein R6X13_12055, partial [bacterium]